MLTRNDLQSCANLSPANLCAASSASDLPTWMVPTYPLSRARPHWTRYKCMPCICTIFICEIFDKSRWFPCLWRVSFFICSFVTPVRFWSSWQLLVSSGVVLSTLVDIRSSRSAALLNSSTSSRVFSMPFSTNHACNMLQVKIAGNIENAT